MMHTAFSLICQSILTIVPKYAKIKTDEVCKTNNRAAYIETAQKRGAAFVHIAENVSSAGT